MNIIAEYHEINSLRLHPHESMPISFEKFSELGERKTEENYKLKEYLFLSGILISEDATFYIESLLGNLVRVSLELEHDHAQYHQIEAEEKLDYVHSEISEEMRDLTVKLIDKFRIIEKKDLGLN